MPLRLQTMSVPIRSQPLRIMNTIIIGSTSSTSALAELPSRSRPAGTPASLTRPNTANRTAATAPEMAAYGKRVRTTWETSASCVSEEEIVVSEMGARLSPKIAPEMIAPHMSPMSMFRLKASGRRTGATAATEPVDVPQEVEISRQAIKPISGIQPAFMPSLEMPQIRAVIRPL